MKHIIIILICSSFLFNCKKKEKDPPEETPPATTTSGTTTGGTTVTPTPVAPAFAAELTVTNTDYNYSYAGAYFFDKDTNAVTIDDLKSNGQYMGVYSRNEYRTANASSLYTGPVQWLISSSRSHIPDTTIASPAFPPIGFVYNSSTVYDKTKDFSVPVDVSKCDSMFVDLGNVIKKIPGKKRYHFCCF